MIYGFNNQSMEKLFEPVFKRTSKKIKIMDLKKILLVTIKELNSVIGLDNSEKVIKNIFDYLRGEIRILKDIEDLRKTDEKQTKALEEIYETKYIDQDDRLANELFNEYKKTYLWEEYW